MGFVGLFKNLFPPPRTIPVPPCFLCPLHVWTTSKSFGAGAHVEFHLMVPFSSEVSAASCHNLNKIVI